MTSGGSMSEIEPHRLTVLADEIAYEARRAEDAWNDALAHAIRAGELLIEAKSLVRHGEWLPWLEANFRGGDRTARQYMHLARNRLQIAGSPTVRDAIAELTESTAPRRADRATKEPEDPWEGRPNPLSELDMFCFRHRGFASRALTGVCLSVFAIIALDNLPASTSDAVTAGYIALIVPFVLFGARLVGLIWDRWLS
jgi:hypothetical protein